MKKHYKWVLRYITLGLYFISETILFFNMSYTTMVNTTERFSRRMSNPKNQNKNNKEIMLFLLLICNIKNECTALSMNVVVQYMMVKHLYSTVTCNQV